MHAQSQPAEEVGQHEQHEEADHAGHEHRVDALHPPGHRVLRALDHRVHRDAREGGAGVHVAAAAGLVEVRGVDRRARVARGQHVVVAVARSAVRHRTIAEGRRDAVVGAAPGAAHRGAEAVAPGEFVVGVAARAGLGHQRLRGARAFERRIADRVLGVAVGADRHVLRAVLEIGAVHALEVGREDPRVALAAGERDLLARRGRVVRVRLADVVRAVAGGAGRGHDQADLAQRLAVHAALVLLHLRAARRGVLGRGFGMVAALAGVGQAQRVDPGERVGARADLVRAVAVAAVRGRAAVARVAGVLAGAPGGGNLRVAARAGQAACGLPGRHADLVRLVALRAGESAGVHALALRLGLARVAARAVDLLQRRRVLALADVEGLQRRVAVDAGDSGVGVCVLRRTSGRDGVTGTAQSVLRRVLCRADRLQQEDGAADGPDEHAKW